MIRLNTVVTLLAAAVCSGSVCAASLEYPATPRKSVSDTYFGTVVSEDYRWLEQSDSPEVKAWIAAQNALMRGVIDALPQRAAIKKELEGMLGGGRVTRRSFVFAGGKLFALKRQPPKNQAMIVVLDGHASLKSERMVLDANVLDPSGKTAIDWFEPSRDGKRVAVSLSKNGSEDGTLYIYDTASGKSLPDVVQRVQYPTGGGSVAWNADGSGLYYTRYPQGDERPQEDANFYMQVYFHRLGKPVMQDEYVLGKDFPRIAEIKLSSSEDGNYLLADVANGDGGEHAYFLRGNDANWLRIADYTDGFRNAKFGRDGRLYALGLKDSPRGRIVALKLDAPGAGLPAAAVVVSESDAVIESVVPTKSRLYVNYLAGGPSELRVFALDGRPMGTLGAEPVANINAGSRLAGDAILFGSQSFIRAFAWYAYDPAQRNAKPVKTRLSDAPIYAVNGAMPDVEVLREFAVSRDGTKVPVNILFRKGSKRDGSQPVLLTGYGGYGISLRPYFMRYAAFWLRHGGAFAIANLRGGGEYGQEWHHAGNLTRKQNVFDDFIASAQLLVERGYSARDRLAILGGSNGGLLMGAAMVQRPELFRAVVSQVGIYDMLRVELTPNGAFNVTEFGTVKDERQFKALHAYSPLHHVRDGVAYPALLLTTGEHDGRVEPWMSYKMTARLQTANPGGRPVLLRVASDAGHGIGTSLASVIDEDADVFAFLFAQLGMQ
ncbi:MAG: S9 family peptidase [Betaproteobacteria bacterium]|nr:MAG: S9 family peptidase [Betaproteobacteria bacterium]